MSESMSNQHAILSIANMQSSIFCALSRGFIGTQQKSQLPVCNLPAYCCFTQCSLFGVERRPLHFINHSSLSQVDLKLAAVASVLACSQIIGMIHGDFGCIDAVSKQ